jgi:hypothetical protein
MDRSIHLKSSSKCKCSCQFLALDPAKSSIDWFKESAWMTQVLSWTPSLASTALKLESSVFLRSTAHTEFSASNRNPSIILLNLKHRFLEGHEHTCMNVGSNCFHPNMYSVQPRLFDIRAMVHVNVGVWLLTSSVETMSIGPLTFCFVFEVSLQ